MSRQLETLTVETVFSRWPFVQQQLADNGLADIADRPEARLAELLDADQLSDLDGFIGVMEEFLGTNEE
jgi:hypothetical protein